MRIDLRGPALELVKVHDPDHGARYAAEIDGRRVPIRMRRRYTNKSYGGPDNSFDDWREDTTMVIWELADIVGITPKRRGDKLVFRFDHEQHYAAYRRGKVTIEFRDGRVDIDVDITERNDGFY